MQLQCMGRLQLMHQIDVLISGKQAEWAGQWTGLETQLREKERELGAVRHTLWQKDTEVTLIVLHSTGLTLVHCINSVP